MAAPIRRLPLRDALTCIKEMLDGMPTATARIGLIPPLIPSFLGALSMVLPGALLVVCRDNETASSLRDSLLFLLGRTGAILPFPEYEPPPFKPLSPGRAVSVKRIETLFRLIAGVDSPIILTTLRGLSRRVISRKSLKDSLLRMREGERMERGHLTDRLLRMGYFPSEILKARGSFTMKGANIEVFPPLSDSPVRFELVGERVTGMREVEAETGRRIKGLDELVILPVREEILDRGSEIYLEEGLESLARERGIPPYVARNILEDIRSLAPGGGVENFLPLFYPELDSLFDYLPPERVVATVDIPDPFRASRGIFEDLKNLFRLAGSPYNPYPPPEKSFLPPPLMDEGLQRGAIMTLGTTPLIHESPRDTLLDIEIDCIPLPPELTRPIFRGYSKGFRALQEYLLKWRDEDFSVLFVNSSPIREGFLTRILTETFHRPVKREEGGEPLKEALMEVSGPRIKVMRGDIREGFVLPEDRIVLLPDRCLFKRREVTGTGRALHPGIPVSEEVKTGDLLVHKNYGICLFRGFERLSIEGVENDFLLLEFRDGDRLFLPVYRMALIHKYISPGGPAPNLDKLGRGLWLRRKERIKEKVDLFAATLLKLYAQRAVKKGFPFLPPDEIYRQFEDSFEYEETEDQKGCMEEVISDMTAPSLMERLICGDVGFGKTEIAMRAAFLAVLSLKQVAILVPTTTLALQHYNNFRERFREYPVNIDILSRLSTGREVDATLRRLADGTTDIVIGTHKLLDSSVRFKDPGLLIIDEEHRFGVSHKERIRRMKSHIDTLYLSATPIPRTLQMSLKGLKDISIIMTPPRERRAVRTFVLRFNPHVIRDAIIFELERGGQVYFIHNFINSIASMEMFLKKLVPQVRIRTIHGRMKEREMEETLLSFYRRGFDLLLSTTIIESGIDIPSANTILVNRADRYGLAQLHQLRGRVGRGGEQGYSYLFTPPGPIVSKGAKERLNTILEYQGLGSGIYISSKDLELRGAGDLLGRSQSGNISAVGFSLYLDILEKKIKEMKGEGIAEIMEPEMDLKISAYIPESYIPDISTRFEYYLKLTSCAMEGDLEDNFERMLDIYGGPPEEVVNLKKLMEIRLILQRNGIEKVEMRGDGLFIRPCGGAGLDMEKIVERASKERIPLTLQRKGTIHIHLEQEKFSLDSIKSLFKMLFS